MSTGDIISLLGLLLGLGVVLDQAIAGVSSKRDAKGSADYSESILHCLALFEVAFGGSNYSVRLLSSLLAYALIVLLLSAYYLGVSAELINLPLSLQIATALGTIFITWLTLQQTKLFMYQSMYSEGFLAKPIFIVSDFFTSTNLFLFLFSAALGVGICAFQIFELNPILKRQNSVISVDVSRIDSEILENRIGIVIDEKFLYLIGIQAHVEGSDPAFDIQNSDYLTLKGDADYLDVQIVLSSLLNREFGKPNSIGFIQLDDSDLFEGYIHNEGFKEIGDEDLNRLIKNGNYIKYRASFDFAPDLTEPSFRTVFRDAFNHVDRIENSLWILKKPADTYEMGHVIDPRGFAFPWGKTHEYYLYCDKSYQFEPMLEDGTVFPEGCYEFELNGNYPAWETLNFASLGPRYVLPMPILPFFIACLLPSLLFYLTVIAHFLVQIFRSVSPNSGPIGMLITKHPYTLSLLLFGLLFSLSQG